MDEELALYLLLIISRGNSHAAETLKHAPPFGLAPSPLRNNFGIKVLVHAEEYMLKLYDYLHLLRQKLIGTNQVSVT